MISANIPNDIRKAIYRRDGFACALCGDPRALAIHHVRLRGSGGGNSPMNLITLCRYCHANAHGIHLSELVIDPEEVEQACVEYVSDMYSLIPWDGEISFDYSDPHEKDIAFQLIDIGVMYLRGVPPKWSGTTYDNG